MSLEEAYNIIKTNKDDKKVIECLEFESFFAFLLAPLDYDKNRDGGIGGAYTTINKINGSISTFNPITDFDSFEKAKRIDLKNIN